MLNLLENVIKTFKISYLIETTSFIRNLWNMVTTYNNNNNLWFIVCNSRPKQCTHRTFLCCLLFSNVRKPSKKITAMFCATLKKRRTWYMIHICWLEVGSCWFFCQYFSDQHSTLFICLFYIHEQHMFLHVYLMIYLFQLIFYVSKQKGVLK